jgi:hypothetical protein
MGQTGRDGRARGQSWRTTLKREVLISMLALYLMKPSLRNLFMK